MRDALRIPWLHDGCHAEALDLASDEQHCLGLAMKGRGRRFGLRFQEDGAPGDALRDLADRLGLICSQVGHEQPCKAIAFLITVFYKV